MDIGASVRMPDDNRAAACPNAASSIHSTRADYCARFRSRKNDDASQQQHRDDGVLHREFPSRQANRGHSKGSRQDCEGLGCLAMAPYRGGSCSAHGSKSRGQYDRVRNGDIRQNERLVSKGTQRRAHAFIHRSVPIIRSRYRHQCPAAISPIIRCGFCRRCCPQVIEKPARIFWQFKKLVAPFDGQSSRGDGTVKSRVLLSAIVLACALTGEASAGRISENSSILRRPTRISCEMVRAYVGQVGVMQARAMALAAGMTPAQERRAAHCLQEKI